MRNYCKSIIRTAEEAEAILTLHHAERICRELRYQLG